MCRNHRSGTNELYECCRQVRILGDRSLFRFRSRLTDEMRAPPLRRLVAVTSGESDEQDRSKVSIGYRVGSGLGSHNSGAIVFMVDMPDGQTVATTLMGREGALASLSVLGPSRSSVTAIARVAGTASLISAAKFRGAYARSAAIRHVVQVHVRSLLLQLQHVAACNALHRVIARQSG